MSAGLWLPGASGPLEEFVTRLLRQVERYAEEVGVERAFVEVELADGARFPVGSISPEPGFGFVTICPHEAAEEDLPERVILPVGMLRRIELRRAEETRAAFGFSVPSAGG